MSDAEELRAQVEALRTQQRAVADLGLLAVRERSLDVMLDEAATLVRRGLGSDFSKVLDLEPDGQLLIRAGSGWPDGVVGELELPGGGSSPAGHALRTRQPVITVNFAEEIRFKPEPVLIELGVRSCVNVVIEGAERPFGVLEVDGREPREWTHDDVSFLQTVANILSSAIERRATDEDRERFLSIAAHELRSPLTAILGFTRRLQRRFSDGAATAEEAVDQLETVHREARRLQHTIAKLSELAQVRHGLTVEIEPVSVTRMLEELVAEASERHPSIDIVQRYPRSEIVVVTDPPLLRTALLNLLENAAKYSPPGSQVHVIAEQDDAVTTLRFRDSCGGLSETQVARLFEPYYRGTPPRGTVGLGIGLYLVRELGRALGWRIDVQNVAGEGCEFTLELPTVDEPFAE